CPARAATTPSVCPCLARTLTILRRDLRGLTRVLKGERLSAEVPRRPRSGAPLAGLAPDEVGEEELTPLGRRLVGACMCHRDPLSSGLLLDPEVHVVRVRRYIADHEDFSDDLQLALVGLPRGQV